MPNTMFYIGFALASRLLIRPRLPIFAYLCSLLATSATVSFRHNVWSRFWLLSTSTRAWPSPALFIKVYVHMLCTVRGLIVVPLNASRRLRPRPFLSSRRSRAVPLPFPRPCPTTFVLSMWLFCIKFVLSPKPTISKSERICGHGKHPKLQINLK